MNIYVILLLIVSLLILTFITIVADRGNLPGLSHRSSEIVALIVLPLLYIPSIVYIIEKFQLDTDINLFHIFALIIFMSVLIDFICCSYQGFVSMFRIPLFIISIPLARYVR